jgi:hypothetical protein
MRHKTFSQERLLKTYNISHHTLTVNLRDKKVVKMTGAEWMDLQRTINDLAKELITTRQETVALIEDIKDDRVITDDDYLEVLGITKNEYKRISKMKCMCGATDD